MYAAFGLVTLVKKTACEPLEAVALVALLIRSWPAVAVLTVQPVVAPRPVGWLILEPVTVKPDGVVQVPIAAVHTWAENDLTAVVWGTVKLKVYEVTAEGTAVPRVRERAVIC